MKAHEKSDIHIQASLAVLAAEGALCSGSVTQQLQNVDRQEEMPCTHFT